MGWVLANTKGHWCWVACTFLVGGCTSDLHLDAGADASTPRLDASASDAGPPDAEPPDAEPLDTGAADTGAPDAATDLQDAGFDAGPVDAGWDAGPPAWDAGLCEFPLLECGGACVEPRTDPMHCGGCDPCQPGESCVAGVCGCSRGWADCDGDPTNGCEASLFATDSCGACGITCRGSTPVCCCGTCTGAGGCIPPPC